MAMKKSFAILGIALIIFTLLPALALASPESRELIRQGIADSKAGKDDEALKKFEAASRADPNDAAAFFFQGTALNRLARFKEALEKLEKAKAMGSKHPELAFETGWSLLRVGRFKEAVSELEAYEKGRPGRGKTSEFLGRAYLVLGELDKAEAKLKEALQRDPSLKPNVLYALAQLERRRNNREASLRYLDTLLKEAPDSPLARTVREESARLAAAREKPWHVGFSVGGGYDSNVIQHGDKALSLPDTKKRSPFGHFTVGGSYNWRLPREDLLSFGYRFAADTYDHTTHKFDLSDHLGVINYRHIFSQKLTGEVRTSNEFRRLGGSNFNNQWLLRPALAYRLTDWAGTELAVTNAVSKYYLPFFKGVGAHDRDRDNHSHTLSLTPFFRVPGTQLTGALGYFHDWHQAVGTDYDYQGNGLTAALSHPLPWQIIGQLSYSHSWDRYKHKNTFDLSDGVFNRRDDIDDVTVLLHRPIFEWLRAYVRFDYTNDQSNIRPFDYKRNITSAGLVVRF